MEPPKSGGFSFSKEMIFEVPAVSFRGGHPFLMSKSLLLGDCRHGRVSLQLRQSRPVQPWHTSSLTQELGNETLTAWAMAPPQGNNALLRDKGVKQSLDKALYLFET